MSVQVTNSQRWDRLGGGPDDVIFSFCDQANLAKLQTVCRTLQQTLARVVDERGLEIDKEYGPNLVAFCDSYDISVRQLPVMPAESLIIIEMVFGRDGRLHGVQSKLIECMTSPIMRFNGEKANAIVQKAVEEDEGPIFTNDKYVYVHVVPTLWGRFVLPLTISAVSISRRLGYTAVADVGEGVVVMGTPKSQNQELPVEGRIAPFYATTDETHRAILSGRHRLMRIRGDERNISEEASMLASVITAATFILNWWLQA